MSCKIDEALVIVDKAINVTKDKGKKEALIGIRERMERMRDTAKVQPSKGAAVLSKNKILIDVANRSTDTLAHEYAHFYIAAFRDTPIVQEAIKKWSENPYKGKIILAHAGIGKSFAQRNNKDFIIDGDDLFVKAANRLVKKYNRSNDETVPIIAAVKNMKSIFTAWGEYDSANYTRQVEAKRRRDEVYEVYAKLAMKAKKDGYTVLSSSFRDPLIKIADVVVTQNNVDKIADNLKSDLRVNQNSETDLVKIQGKIDKAIKVAKDNNIKHIELKADEFLEDILFKDGKEKLVQAIGEQVVKQKGEVYGWWKKFSQFVKGMFTGLDQISKEKLVELLTDAFLSNKDIRTSTTKPNFTVQPKAAPDAVKAPYKASRATKYIGYGAEGSSTALYAQQLKQQGMPINNGKYTANDVVFVSVNGKPTTGNFVSTLNEVLKALDAGATVLTDSATYLNNSTYNKGEKELAVELLERGYVQTTSKGNKDVAEWAKDVLVDKTAVDNRGVREQADTKSSNGIMDKAKAIGTELGLRDELVNETIAKLEKCSKG